MVKQNGEFESCKLNEAKLHRHQRVQKILAKKKSSRSRPSCGYSSSDDVSSISTSSSEVYSSKKQERMLKNRRSAVISREKKKKETETLQSRIKDLEHENSILRSLITEKYPNIQIELINAQKMEPVDSSSYVSKGSSTQTKVPVAVSNHNEYAIHF